MDIANFEKYISGEILMGPSSARILEALWKKHPLQLASNDIVLDLGCGKGLSSLILAKETPAMVYACDLWISEEENQSRFVQWGIQDKVAAFHDDANELHFSKVLFQALVSVDSYHYFATTPGFFQEKILPFLKDGAEVLIGIPGMKREFSGRSEELMSPWLGEEAYMFQSPDQWREIIGNHERIEVVETWELECFDLAWNEWFATDNQYAAGDKAVFESLNKPYTCFVGIYIKLK